MPSWKRLFSGEHLDSSDIPDKQTPTVRIVAVTHIEVDGQKGERKALITFEPSPGFAKVCKKRTWVAAKVCCYCIGAMFGDNYEGWIGKQITLCVEEESAFGELTTAVRVKGSPQLQAPTSIRVRMGARGKVTFNLTPTGMSRLGSDGQ